MLLRCSSIMVTVFYYRSKNKLFAVEKNMFYVVIKDTSLYFLKTKFSLSRVIIVKKSILPPV